MNDIAKVSDITDSDVAEYLRLAEPSQDDLATIDMLMVVAKDYIQKYTGREDLDEYQDFVIVVLILCQDMWDNRAFYVEESNVNKVVQTILDMHSVNLL